MKQHFGFKRISNYEISFFIFPLLNEHSIIKDLLLVCKKS